MINNLFNTMNISAGSATDFVLQEPGPGGAVAGLCREADGHDPEHNRICKADSRIHAAQPG